MDIQLIGLVFFAVGISFFKYGANFAIKMFVPSTLLASCAAFIVPGLGAATVQPAHLLLGFLTLCVLKNKHYWKPMLNCMTFPREGFWLVAIAVYGVVGSYLFPRIFAGSTYVNAIGATEFGFSFVQVPLGPSSGNITQSIYFCGDVICFLICYAIAQTREGFMSIVSAMLIYCGLNIVFALLDLATFWTGTGFLLDLIRNSTYTLHNETVVYGLKRIVGSFTEASAFAYAAIGAFAFTLRLWLGGVAKLLTLALTVVNGLLIIFSTSTTGYAALPVIIVYIYITTFIRFIRKPVPSTVNIFLTFTPLFVVLLVCYIFLNPSYTETVMSYLNLLLFDKSSSSSAIDRGQWNTSAINAFRATYGLGAGIGSVRASSFIYAVMANLGALGSAFYLGFIALTQLRREGQPLDMFTMEARAAARAACMGILISASISGALIDLGLPFFVLSALATAASRLET